MIFKILTNSTSHSKVSMETVFFTILIRLFKLKIEIYSVAIDYVGVGVFWLKAVFQLKIFKVKKVDKRSMKTDFAFMWEAKIEFQKTFLSRIMSTISISKILYCDMFIRLRCWTFKRLFLMDILWLSVKIHLFNSLTDIWTGEEPKKQDFSRNSSMKMLQIYSDFCKKSFSLKHNTSEESRSKFGFSCL